MLLYMKQSFAALPSSIRQNTLVKHPILQHKDIGKDAEHPCEARERPSVYPL